MAQEIIVQKYGGSSVSDVRSIKKVALFIKSCLSAESKIVAVVSAMGHTTNELIALAHDVCSEPPKRELDMLISCGERSSMALLAMALNDIGVKAMSLTGSQSGIITDDNHHGAEIIAIKPERVLQAFSDHQVVIIAGFQGVSEKREITTLRRGGSDTTAVAMAAAIDAKVCEIYTDVPGVTVSDPRIVKSASILPTISFTQMESMALYGARVLAHDAIRLAKEFNVTLRVLKTGERNGGTKIQGKSLMLQEEPMALTHLRALIRITMPPAQFENLKNEAYFLCGRLSDEAIVAYTSNDISQELIGNRSHIDVGLALITIHFRKNHAIYPLLARLNQVMTQQKIACVDLIISGSEIFVIVNDDDLNRALPIFRESITRSLESAVVPTEPSL